MSASSSHTVIVPTFYLFLYSNERACVGIALLALVIIYMACLSLLH